MKSTIILIFTILSCNISSAIEEIPHKSSPEIKNSSTLNISGEKIDTKTTFTDGFIRNIRVSPALSAEQADKLENQGLDGLPIVNTWKKISYIERAVSGDKILGESQKSASSVFIYATAEFAEETSGQICIGYNSQFKLFLNGKSIESDAPEKTHPFIPDAFRKEAKFRGGINTIVLRLDRLKDSHSVALRIISTAEQLDQVVNWFQPKTITEYSKNQKPSDSQLINNTAYRYFIKAPFVQRKNNPNIRHAIMCPMYKEYHTRYATYCDQSKMPCPDILELRSPLYAIYDVRNGETSCFVDKALSNALQSQAAQVEVSVISVLGQHVDTNPEIAANPVDFNKIFFKDNQPELMLNSKGNPVEAPAWDPYVNRACYSYHDLKHRNFVMQTAALAASKLKSLNNSKIGALHVRFPSSKDWYYPIDDEFYDYSPSAQTAFRKFLKDKYISIGTLNSHYASAYPDFESIKAPLPKFGEMDISSEWQDWQAFRSESIYGIQREIFQTIRKIDSDREIVSWMTSSIKAGARDGIILDDAMRLEREFPHTFITLTCFDFMGAGLPLAGELYGQLALAYGLPIAIEPLRLDPESYQKTFYNILRFPVKKANWLFFIHLTPAATPWIIWVMNQRGLADELAEAKLLQSKTVNIFSYSDIRLNTTTKLGSDEIINPQIKLFKALQAHSLNLPMITDYSLEPELNAYESVLLADTKLLRPEMIAKIGKFVRDGGTALIVGNVGEYDLSSGKKDYPLLRELGIPSKSVHQDKSATLLMKVPSNAQNIKYKDSFIEEASWSLGKGQVFFHSQGISSFLNADGYLNSHATDYLNSHGISPLLRFEQDGLAASFVKANGKIRYLGFINTCGGAFSTNLSFIPAEQIAKLDAIELVSGEKLQIKNGSFNLSFEIPWQIKVIKLELE